MRNLTGHYAALMGLYWSNFAVLANYASVYLLRCGFQNTQIGLMIAAAALCSALAQPLLGAYADRPRSPSVKRILLVMIGLFLFFAALIPLSAQRMPWVLLVAYAMALMLMNSMVPLLNAVAMLSAGTGNRLNFGFARGIGSLMYACVSLLLGGAVERLGVSLIPPVAIVLYSSFWVCLLLFPFHKGKRAAVREERTRFLQKYPRFLMILLSASCLYSSHALLNNFTFQIVSFKGGSSQSMGVIFAVAALAELPMMFFFARLLRRIPAGRWLVISGVAFVCKCVGVLLVPHVAGMIAVQLIQVFAYAVIAVASVYYMNDSMEPQDAVKGQALFAMTNMVGAVIGSALGGWLLDACGVRALLWTAVGFAAAGAVTMRLGIGSLQKPGA